MKLKMKVFEFSIFILFCVVYVCFGQDLEDENAVDNQKSLFHYTTTREGTCVKIYYTGENFYKVYCFEHLKTRNNTLGIITNRNDTILYAGYGENSECFDIYKSKSKNKTLICLNVTSYNCIDDLVDEPHRKTDKIQEIPCQISQNVNFLGLHLEKLNIIFRCVVYSLEAPDLSTDKDDSVRVRYCFNRRIVTEDDKAEKFWNTGLKLLDKIIKQKSSNIFNTTDAAPLTKER